MGQENGLLLKSKEIAYDFCSNWNKLFPRYKTEAIVSMNSSGIHDGFIINIEILKIKFRIIIFAKIKEDEDRLPLTYDLFGDIYFYQISIDLFFDYFEFIVNKVKDYLLYALTKEKEINDKEPYLRVVQGIAFI